MSERKDVAVLCGGDWHDAAVDHLSVPKGLDLQGAYKRYREWYKTYLVADKPATYFTFAEWLLKFEGATQDHNVEVFEE